MNEKQNLTPVPTDSGVGFLIVRVTTALGAIPLENASVTVRSYEIPDKIFATSKSDRNGNTERLSLPAPGISKSFEPGGEAPFSTYNISAYAQGYRVQYLSNIPIFDGITSVQQIDLVPLSENGYGDNRSQYGKFYVETENPLL